MDLLPTSEQQQIIESAAVFLADKLPVERLHGAYRGGAETDGSAWRELAGLGWLGLAIDEAKGGVGYSAVEDVLLFQQLGRVLAPPRILFTVVAARAAAAAGAQDLVEKLISGDIRAALAVHDDFETSGSEFGRRRLYEGSGAAVALAVDGPRSALLDLRGARFEATPCLDSSVSLARADLSACPVLCRSDSPEVGRAGILLTAALQVGLAQQTVDMLVGYAKLRETFGRPIGAYQAVRHPCAEMAARAKAAEAQLYLAAVATRDRRADGPLQVAAARVLAERAAMLNADDNIQLHGGIGVTEEFTAHFFMKRANLMTTWFGDRRAHLHDILATPAASSRVPA